MKLELVVVLTLASAFVGTSLGDTKVLRNVQILVHDSNRAETFSLNNENTSEEELVIEGTHKQKFPAGDANHIYAVETVYVADKDGYRAKYKFVREKFERKKLQLSPSSLKSLSG